MSNSSMIDSNTHIDANNHNSTQDNASNAQQDNKSIQQDKKSTNKANSPFGHTSLFDQNNHIEQPPRGIDQGLILCHCCGRLNQSAHKADHFDAEDKEKEHLKCERCHSPLHQRKTASLERTLAFLIAASILYIPANVLPMTITESVLGNQQDTIMSGVIYFWHSGDYFVATVIFMASIFIPMLKLVILALLLTAVHLQASRRIQLLPAHCAILYRVVEFIGRWSMIDVFVVALLAALIQIHSLATILAGAGSVAFGAVVVLTMLASLSFDPRIIWDNYAQAQKQQGNHQQLQRPITQPDTDVQSIPPNQEK